ncbi:MAG: CBS domain-containing protein [Nitrososphaerales archaeon]
MKKVEKYMIREVFVLNPNNSLAKARNLMLNKKIGRLVIVDEKERILGIISRSDMAFALGRGSSRWREKTS